MALALASIAPASAFAGDVVFAPVVSAHTRYDNNITSRSAEDKRLEDYVMRVTPFLDLSHSTRSTKLSTLYRPTAQLYAGHPEMNTVSHAWLTDLVLNPSLKTRITLNDTFTYTKEPNEATMAGIQTERDGVWTNSIKGYARYEVRPTLSLGVTASDYIVEFAAPSLIDTRSDTAEMDVEYALSSKLALTGSYTFTNYTFTPSSGVDSSSQVHSVLAGTNWSPMEGLFVRLSAGAPITSEKTAGDNWRAEASISRNFSRGMATFAYARSINSAAGLDEKLAVYDNFKLYTRYSITPLIDIGVNGTYFHYRLSEDALKSISSYETGVEVSWKANKWLTVSGGFVHYKQWYKGESSEDINVLRDYGYVNLTATPRPFRF